MSTSKKPLTHDRAYIANTITNNCTMHQLLADAVFIQPAKNSEDTVVSFNSNISSDIARMFKDCGFWRKTDNNLSYCALYLKLPYNHEAVQSIISERVALIA